MLVKWNIIIAVNNTHQLQVTKNRYIYVDYGSIRNATCHLTWASIGVCESFLRRES